MKQVFDYSAGFPGAPAIKNTGAVGAVRYIGFPGNRKCTTRDELNDFSRNGLGMALVFEQSIGNWAGGYTRGQIDARLGRDHASAIGWPVGHRPIYMAVDQDVVRLDQFDIMVDYLRGAGSVLGGPGLTGVYGEADVCDRAREAGVAAYRWQTAAWSRGRVASKIHLYQRIGLVTVNGIGCDVSDVLNEDWGQHDYEGDGMGAFEDFQAHEVVGPDGVRRGGGDALLQTHIWAGQLGDMMKAGFAAVTAALAAGFSHPDITPDQLAAIIEDKMPKVADIAAEITPKLVDAVLGDLRTVVLDAINADNQATAEATADLVVADFAARLGRAA